MKAKSCYDCAHHAVCEYTLVGRGKCQVPVRHDDDIEPLLVTMAMTCAAYCKHFTIDAEQTRGHH